MRLMQCEHIVVTMRRCPMTNNDKIIVKKSSKADTRTCDYAKVTENELFIDTMSHITDIRDGIDYFIERLVDIKHKHDRTKLSGNGCAINHQFYSEFKTGFKTQRWYDAHQMLERHHLTEEKYVQDDVNLLDIIEMITDNVMAGIARSGEYRDEKIPDVLLRKAFDNTIKDLLSKVDVREGDA